MFDAVCLDNDGLLLETESAWTRAEEVLFRRCGSEFTADHKRFLIGSSGPEAQRKLEQMLDMPGRGAELWEQLHGLVMDEAAAGIEAMPGALELVDLLAAAGTPYAVVSNSAREFVELTLRTAGVRDRFAVVLAREDVDHGKPAPDLYLAACAALGADPGRCAGLEDTATGVASLRAAGLYAIGIPSFPGVQLGDADLIAGSLADAAVHRALGVG